MVYGREIDGRELTLEASGALLDASLVMRDRETDSWWSLMSSSAIGGELEGTELPELAGGEKTTWGDWRARHPETRVLSVDGREHVERNPYDDYFGSERTFREIAVEDDRLPAKEPIFAFQSDGRSWAAPHSAIEGGRIFDVGGSCILVSRPPDAPLMQSSRAFLVGDSTSSRAEGVEALLARVEAGELEPVPGFDTFWYTWVAVNPETRLLE